VDGWLGWHAAEWSALGALVAAGAAVATFIVAIVAAVAAFKQVKQARKLREEQAQPYVAVYLEPNVVSPQIVDLVVRNFGATAALDVRVPINPSPKRASAQAPYDDVVLPEVLPTLVPGQEWRTYWDWSADRLKSDLPNEHKAVASYRDSRGKQYSLEYRLDWSTFKDRLWTDTYGVHHAAKALREMNKRMERWQEGIHGLAVFVRDGDEKDRRDLEERKKAKKAMAEYRRRHPARGEDGATSAEGEPADGSPNPS
jgi:hypothetical protein